MLNSVAAMRHFCEKIVPLESVVATFADAGYDLHTTTFRSDERDQIVARLGRPLDVLDGALLYKSLFQLTDPEELDTADVGDAPPPPRSCTRG